MYSWDLSETRQLHHKFKDLCTDYGWTERIIDKNNISGWFINLCFQQSSSNLVKIPRIPNTTIERPKLHLELHFIFYHKKFEQFCLNRGNNFSKILVDWNAFIRMGEVFLKVYGYQLSIGRSDATGTLNWSKLILCNSHVPLPTWPLPEVSARRGSKVGKIEF